MPKKKLTRKRKPAYNYENAIVTLTNAVSAKRQESVLHPYPRVKATAVEVHQAMVQILSSISLTPLTKNEILNRIASYPLDTGHDAVPLLRTLITANRLVSNSALRDFDSARSLIEAGISVATDEELPRFQWMGEALGFLESLSFSKVNFSALSEISNVAAKYPLSQISNT